MNTENVLRRHGVGAGGGGSNINSVQRGSINMTHNRTNAWAVMSKVNLDTSILLLTASNADGINPGFESIMGEFFSATDLKFTRRRLNGVQRIDWQVIEYDQVKSMQRGVVNIERNTSTKTLPINAVDPEKSILHISYNSENLQAFDGNNLCTGRVVNSTQLELNHFLTVQGVSSDIAWQIIEFK